MELGVGHVELFPFVIDEIRHGPLGPAFRDLYRRGFRVETQAKLNASHPPPSQPGTGPAVRSGRLRASITTVPGRDGLGIFVDVGSKLVYANRVEVDYNRPYLRPALPAASG
jgi:hypothetical protein